MAVATAFNISDGQFKAQEYIEPTALDVGDIFAPISDELAAGSTRDYRGALTDHTDELARQKAIKNYVAIEEERLLNAPDRELASVQAADSIAAYLSPQAKANRDEAQKQLEAKKSIDLYLTGNTISNRKQYLPDEIVRANVAAGQTETVTQNKADLDTQLFNLSTEPSALEQMTKMQEDIFRTQLMQGGQTAEQGYNDILIKKAINEFTSPLARDLALRQAQVAQQTAENNIRKLENEAKIIDTHLTASLPIALDTANKVAADKTKNASTIVANAVTAQAQKVREEQLRLSLAETTLTIEEQKAALKVVEGLGEEIEIDQAIKVAKYVVNETPHLTGVMNDLNNTTEDKLTAITNLAQGIISQGVTPEQTATQIKPYLDTLTATHKFATDSKQSVDTLIQDLVGEGGAVTLATLKDVRKSLTAFHGKRFVFTPLADDYAKKVMGASNLPTQYKQLAISHNQSIIAAQEQVDLMKAASSGELFTAQQFADSVGISVEELRDTVFGESPYTDFKSAIINIADQLYGTDPTDIRRRQLYSQVNQRVIFSISGSNEGGIAALGGVDTLEDGVGDDAANWNKAEATSWLKATFPDGFGPNSKFNKKLLIEEIRAASEKLDPKNWKSFVYGEN
jgi:hypothetical protein